MAFLSSVNVTSYRSHHKLRRDTKGVDAYGDGITRDLEPTLEDGGSMWKLFLSCMRVFKSGTPTCANTTELCCMRGTDSPETDWVNARRFFFVANVWLREDDIGSHACCHA
jgi:hypothetical protein